MSLLTDNSAPPCGSVSLRGRDGDVPTDIAVLNSDICRDPRWCPNCGGEQTFVAVYEFHEGRFGFCLGCGDERLVPFSRVNSEAQ
jgi:hypothetical protein